MTLLIISIAVLLASFALEYFLSRNKRSWPGLLIPALSFLTVSLFLAFNVVDAFSSISGYGLFLVQYGRAGFVALILKIGVLYMPVMIQLVIYALCRRSYKKKNPPSGGNRELKKMIVDDMT